MHIPLLFLGVLVPSSVWLRLVQPTSARPILIAHPTDLPRPHTERLERRAPLPPVRPSVRVSPARGQEPSPFQKNPLNGAGSGGPESDFHPTTGQPVELVSGRPDLQNDRSSPLPDKDAESNNRLKTWFGHLSSFGPPTITSWSRIPCVVSKNCHYNTTRTYT